MTRPADLPAADHWPHGVRARYTSGCRYADCRRANAAYQSGRARALVYGRANPIVDASPVRAHLQQLRAQGLGRDAVAAASDVRATTVGDLAAGKKKRIRKATADRLLAVTAAAIADGALVDAGPTWKLIRKLLREGFTRGELAQRLGAKTPALQLRRRRVLASTAQKVARFYSTIMAGAEAVPARGAAR
jgi:hypothetical protein